MPGGDPASSPRASTRHTPADEADSLRDLLAEPLLLARLAAPRTDRTGAILNGPQGIEYVPLARDGVTALVNKQIAAAGLDDAQEFTELTRARVRELFAEQMAKAGKEVNVEPKTIDVLEMMSCDENHTLALRALCWLRLLGHEGRSLDEIGDEFGVVRATVDNIYVSIQERYAARGIILTSRGDKSPAARAACRARRLGKRKPKTCWKGTRQWLTPILPH